MLLVFILSLSSGFHLCQLEIAFRHLLFFVDNKYVNVFLKCTVDSFFLL